MQFIEKLARAMLSPLSYLVWSECRSFPKVAIKVYVDGQTEYLASSLRYRLAASYLLPIVGPRRGRPIVGSRPLRRSKTQI